MFDLANYYSTSPVLLDEHFRSYAPIVEFSNKEFYGSRMRVMSRAKVKNVLELVQVPEGKVDFDVTRNAPECEAIIQKLHEIILNDEKRQQEKLLYLSETDRMTGINNRGSGEKKIRELIAEGQGGMFVLMDVDKFKSINDNYGHNVGDKVLIEFAGCLKKAFRANDIIMRLGGDEFAVYVPDVHNEAAGERIINRLFNVLDNTDIPELNGNKFYISAGAAFYQTDDKYSFEELYKRADSCTYISKKHKGNYASYYEAKKEQ